MTWLVAALGGRIGSFLTVLAGLAMLVSLSFWYGHHRGDAEGYARADALRTADRANADRAALHAALTSTTTTGLLINTSTETAHATDQQFDSLRSDLDRARAAAVAASVREQAILAAAGRRVDVPADPAASCSSAAATAAAWERTARMLADVRGRTVEAALHFSDAADDANARGLACESFNDTVRAGVNEQTTH